VTGPIKKAEKVYETATYPNKNNQKHEKKLLNHEKECERGGIRKQLDR